MTEDSRDTGEHFFGSLVGPSPEAAASTARRVADLTAQIGFLDHEIARYREMLERDRIAHATALADHALEADTRVDKLRREHRRETKALRDRYRALLASRQVDHDSLLRETAAAHAEELERVLAHHGDVVEHERARGEAQVEAVRRQTIDELNDLHRRSHKRTETELRQAKTAIDRLRANATHDQQRLKSAEANLVTLRADLVRLQRAHDGVQEGFRGRQRELEQQLAKATRRLEAERQRSAATLAEVLHRSATVAAEADELRARLAGVQAKSDHEVATALEQLRADGEKQAAAAEARLAAAARRETELEAVIADLRSQLASVTHPVDIG